MGPIFGPDTCIEYEWAILPQPKWKRIIRNDEKEADTQEDGLDHSATREHGLLPGKRGFETCELESPEDNMCCVWKYIYL